MKPWERGSYDDDFGMSRPVPVFKVGQAAAPTAHILICAPSNSALDEIVLRLMHGILDRCADRTFALSFKPSSSDIGEHVCLLKPTESGGKGSFYAASLQDIEACRHEKPIMQAHDHQCMTTRGLHCSLPNSQVGISGSGKWCPPCLVQEGRHVPSEHRPSRIEEPPLGAVGPSRYAGCQAPREDGCCKGTCLPAP